MTELTQQRKEFEKRAMAHHRFRKEDFLLNEMGEYPWRELRLLQSEFDAGYEAGRSSLESENERLRELLKEAEGLLERAQDCDLGAKFDTAVSKWRGAIRGGTNV